MFKKLYCLILLSSAIILVRAQQPRIVIQEGHNTAESIDDRGLLLSHDGQYLLTWDPAGMHKLWDVKTGQLIRNFKSFGNESLLSLMIKPFSDKTFGGPSLSDNNNLLLTENGDTDHSYMLWDTSTGDTIRSFHQAHSGNTIAYSSAQLVGNEYVLVHGIDHRVNAYMIGRYNLHRPEANDC
jgi:WD40 repeat protein